MPNFPSETSLVIVESPFGSPIRLIQHRNKFYLAACLRDCWNRGEIPFASHGFFPIFLNEGSKEERDAGISAGYFIWQFASRLVIYEDFGITSGMEKAIERAKQSRIIMDKLLPIEFRSLGDFISNPQGQGR